MIFLLVIIYLSFVGLGIPNALLGSAWPAMYEGLGVPITSAGLVQIMISGGAIISSLFAGKIIKRVGFATATIESVITMTISLIVISFSPNFLFLCIWAIPLGLGTGLLDATINSYAALYYKSKHMNWLHCCWGVGCAVGSVIISFSLVNWQSWQLGYRIGGIFQIVIIALLFISFPRWKKPATTLTNEGDERSKDLSIREMLSLSGAKETLIAFFIFGSLGAIMTVWGSSYFVTIHNVPPETAASWISLYFLGLTAGRFLAGLLAIKFTNKQLVQSGELLIGAGLTIMLLPLPTTTILFGFILIGFGFAPLFPCLIHETPVRFGKNNSQHMMGFQMACASIGMTTMPQLLGMLVKKTSYKLLPPTIGVLLLILVYTIQRLYRKIIIKTTA